MEVELEHGEVEAALLRLIRSSSGVSGACGGHLLPLILSLGKLFSRGKSKKAGKAARVGYKDVCSACVATFVSHLGNREDLHRVVLTRTRKEE